MASNIPLCKSCSQPYKLMKETEQWFEFGCETCKVGHVFSKPKAKAAGRYFSNLKRDLETAQRIRQWEARPRYSFPSQTRTPKEID